MFIAFIFLVTSILLGIMGAIYSIFYPFMKSVGEVVNFNTAYYGAIAGLERAQLTLRYKEPGFEGSGGFFGSAKFGPQSDTFTGAFGMLTKANNGFSWKISSRTTQIPVPGQGNVDYLLAAADSNNYNKLPYFSSEKIFFSLDTTTNPEKYYTSGSIISYFTGGSFNGKLRLPPKIVQQLASVGASTELCENCDVDGDSINDDVVVNRVLNGLYDGKEFSIIPYIDVFYYSGGHVNYAEDIAIREDLINNTGMLYFGATTTQNKYSPIYGDPAHDVGYGDFKKNIIVSDAQIDTGASFNDILLGGGSFALPGTVTGVNYTFGIVNLLLTTGDFSSIYPFLEYQYSFPQPVADTFYTIQGNALVGDYNVTIYLKKSTNDQQSIGDFTVIF